MALTHIDQDGHVIMVDVSKKEISERSATASAALKMRPETLDLILAGEIKKGDVFACARVAGIMAAKRTPDLIPLCHPLPLNSVKVDIQPLPPDGVAVNATVTCSHTTGVEMEALCAASVAALTIYDMCKAIDRGMHIEAVRLIHKSGGKSGEYKYKEEKAQP